MRQKSANRAVIIMAAAFVLACVGFAWVVDRPPPAPPAPVSLAADPGSHLYTARCQRCHELDEAWELLQQDQDRAAQLLRLEGHRKAEASENALILDYLRGHVGTKARGREGE